MHHTGKDNKKPVALIDIGSNSIRLVIYDELRKSPMPLFNEKVLCGLARDMDKTGMLCKEGVKEAYDVLARFVTLARISNVVSLNLFATSAVRDAKDGAEFVAKIKANLNVDIQVLSGEEEANFAAYGVIASIKNAKGVVGDLGGGSLELIEVNNSNISNGFSSPIGLLRLNSKYKTREKRLEAVESYLSKYPLRELLEEKTFYAVGGTFRSLAKLHMEKNHYPLRVIHGYKVKAEDIAPMLDITERMPESALSKLGAVSKNRSSSLPSAALILNSIIKIGKPENIVFSSNGVREGLLYSNLDLAQKRFDPLIAGAVDMSLRADIPSDYGHELMEWMKPLFPGHMATKEAKLMLAACILGEIACCENAEYRAEIAYRRIMDSSLVGLDHADRVFIAKSVYFRYRSVADEEILKEMQSFLRGGKLLKTQIIGYAMRLARNLSCANIGILQNTPLSIDKGCLVLHLEGRYSALKGEAVERRLEQLAEILNLKSVISS